MKRILGGIAMSLLPSRVVLDPLHAIQARRKPRTTSIPATAGGPGRSGIPKVSAFMAEAGAWRWPGMPRPGATYRAARRERARLQRREVLAALGAGVAP